MHHAVTKGIVGKFTFANYKCDIPLPTDQKKKAEHIKV